jgi:transcriptional regulator GlxA family with amidase domain
VQDGNIWSSSGVGTGVAVVIAWMASVFGDDVAQIIADGQEYVRHRNSVDHPFAALYNLADVNSTHPSQLAARFLNLGCRT